MSLPKYAQYRSCGIPWLGDIPEHWTTVPLKAVTSGSDSSFVDGDWIESRHLAETGVRYITTGNVGPGFYKEQGAGYISDETFTQLGCTAVQPGDVLISRLNAPIGRACLAPDLGVKVVTSVDNVIVRPSQQFDRRFLVFRLSSPDYFHEAGNIASGATMQRISRTELGNMRIAFPPLNEQTAIAAFLDRETTKIDALIAEQEKLIALLAEKRQATISHAVTRGLNPNAPMKDSGVAWLGEVPAHWQIGAVKHFFKTLDSRRVPLSAEERSGRQGAFPYYGASGVIDSIDDFIFDEDLVLVSEDGANLLNRASPIAFVASGQYWVNNHAHILKPMDINLRFWAERIETIDLAPVVTGAAQPKLTIEALMNLPISAPDTSEERAAISAFIDVETAKLDALDAQSTHTIALLKERRTALIAAAVTGQIDVRNIPLS